MNINNNPSTVISAGKDSSQKTREVQTDPFGVLSFSPEESLQDPVQKLRISQPQALIDTDFEYGSQTTKWENLAMTNFRPFVYNNVGSVISVTGLVIGSGSKRVTGYVEWDTRTSGTPNTGAAITVLDSFLNIANGGFVVESANPNNGTFIYTANAVNNSPLIDIFDDLKTSVQSGTIFSSSEIAINAIMTATGGAGLHPRVTATCTGANGIPLPHGLSIGNPIAVVGATATTNPPNGSWTVSRIISPQTFVFAPDSLPTGPIVGARIYPNPQGLVLHRPSDGGVIFSANANSNFEQITRQTRRYFRYQSGKGFQISSGTLLKPNIQIESMTYSESTGLVTVQTKERHNLLASFLPGTVISIQGANEPEYNITTADFITTGYNTFVFNPIRAGFEQGPTYAPVASGNFSLTISAWYGASNRLGLFDDQNGVFFEYDGSKLYVVKRSSTFQLSGKVTVTNGSCVVTQTSVAFPTIFSKQLNVGDGVVIRGASYRVTQILSDTEMVISPRYRGLSAQFANVSRTVDTKIAQNDWNIDKFDGKGKSGYQVDLSKMQMFYIDYSWYGAGFVRWGMRATNGKVIYCHRMVNNNVNTEAYMRSGNLPARYETVSKPPYTYLTQELSSATTASVNVAKTEDFPTQGTIVISQGNNVEYINYTGKTISTFTGLTRGRGGATISTLNVTATANVFVVSSLAGLQVGQRLLHADLPENTFIIKMETTESQNLLTLNTRPTVSVGTLTNVIAVPMGTSTAFTWTPSSTNPVLIELAWPTFSPTMSHWGTSVIMDGRYDDDKSLLFTYGNSGAVAVAANTTNVLLAIRCAPSIDNGTAAPFGGRELINRMQLVLNSLDVTATTSSGLPNLLVTIVLNGKPVSPRNWTSVPGVPASLAQIADYAAQTTNIIGGETVGGFFTQGVTSIDLKELRDLGNSILGGGGPTTADQYYPDGPDVYHILVRNLSNQTANVFARLSWKEAQA